MRCVGSIGTLSGLFLLEARFADRQGLFSAGIGAGMSVSLEQPQRIKLHLYTRTQPGNFALSSSSSFVYWSRFETVAPSRNYVPETSVLWSNGARWNWFLPALVGCFHDSRRNQIQAVTLIQNILAFNAQTYD